MNKSQKISDWLDKHTLFSINGMCKQVGVNTPNFMRYKDSSKIPEKFIPKIEKILAEYGYNVKN
jgi:ACT domain-containing protein